MLSLKIIFNYPFDNHTKVLDKFSAWQIIWERNGISFTGNDREEKENEDKREREWCYIYLPKIRGEWKCVN